MAAGAVAPHHGPFHEGGGEYYCVTGVPVDGWEHEAGFVDSFREEMEAILGGSHRVVQALVDATDEVTEWPFWKVSAMPGS